MKTAVFWGIFLPHHPVFCQMSQKGLFEIMQFSQIFKVLQSSDAEKTERVPYLTFFAKHCILKE